MRRVLYLCIIMFAACLIKAEAYAGETSVVIMSTSQHQDGQPGADAENGLTADYYHFDKEANAFTEYVSSEFVDDPFICEDADARKAHALRSVGFLDAKGVVLQGKIRFPEKGLYVLSAETSRGVRVKIDDIPVIDKWDNNQLNTIPSRGMLIGKQSVHDISIEYYYTSGDEQFSLYWENDNSIETGRIPASFFYPDIPRDIFIETAEPEDEMTLRLCGKGLENISGITVVPFSLSSVKEPVSCAISKKGQDQIVAKLSSKLTPGTYSLEYAVQDRIFRADVSFWINAGEDTSAEAAGPAHREEHPRPDRYRQDWISLNGAWKFEFDSGRTGEEEEWYRQKEYTRTINVPFAWQSDESWIGDDSGYSAAWYEREFAVDEDWLQEGKHCFLYFGAVDAEAIVYVNGEKAGSHVGGYTPFEFDVTGLVRAGKNKLTVEVIDEGCCSNDLYPALIGKQGYDAPCGYEPTSGIWQSVFLESRGEAYIDSLQVCPQVPDDTADRSVEARENGTSPVPDYSTADCSVRFDTQICSDREMDAVIRYSFSGTVWDEASGTETETDPGFSWSMNVHIQEGLNQVSSPDIAVPGAKLWSDIAPNRYVGSVEIIEVQGEGKDPGTNIIRQEESPAEDTPVDHLETYFGFRRVGTGKLDGRDYEYIFVNGRPVFLSGALDQGYWAGCGYTAPSQEALKNDIVFLKECGFNAVRKHLKIEDPLQYFWCDRLGIYLMQDMPYATAMNAREDGGAAPGRHLYEKTLEEFLHMCTGHPSLISIQLFNEGWGVQKPGQKADDGMTTLEWQQYLYDTVKATNDSILIEDMSPNGKEHIQPTDINSFHSYPTSYTNAKSVFDMQDEGTVSGGTTNFREGYCQETEPWINSEYSGVGVFSGDLDISFCLKYQTDLLRQHEKLGGLVYTQTCDVEYERNGLRTFDRKEKVFGYDEIAYGGDMTIRDLMQPAYIGIVAEPVKRCLPDSEFTVEVAGMNWSEHDYDEVTLHWVLEGTDTEGVRFGGDDIKQGLPLVSDQESERVFLSGETGFSYPRFTKSTKMITFTLPDSEGVAVLTVWIEKDGAKIAKNFMYIVLSDDEPDPAFEVLDSTYILRGDPEEKHMEGSGTVTVHFTDGCYGLQEYLKQQSGENDPGSLSTMRLVMELSSVKGYRRSNGIRHSPASQTTLGDEKPCIVNVSANGIYLDTIMLDDDCRDMRGVLTLQNGKYGGTSAGDFGELVFVEADSEKTAMLLESMEDTGYLDVMLTVPDSTDYSNGVRVYDDTEGRYMVRPAIVISNR